jgi:ABC-type uncharacterized transport system involved in gliding motility auxiliary subunit
MKNASNAFLKGLGGLIGLIALLAILVAINAIISSINIRKDLTDEKLYSLSDGTRSMLSKLERPVTLKLFFSKSSTKAPIFLKHYAREVEDLLNEYRIAGNGKVFIETHDTAPDSDAEEWARRYGIGRQKVEAFGPPIYFGLVATSGTAEDVIPALSPATARTLEYSITRLLYRISHPEKPTVGVITSLPLLGDKQPYRIPGRPPPRPPWMAIQDIQNDYAFEEISTPADEISKNIDVLLLAHPKQLTDRTLYAIDQFVLRGGKLLAFLDPMSTADIETSNAAPKPGTPPIFDSDLGVLLSAWGIKYDSARVLVDMKAVSRIQMGPGQAEDSPVWLTLRKTHLTDDVLTAELDIMMMPFAGSFEDNTDEDLKVTPLIVSSDSAMMIDASFTRYGPQVINNQFSPAGKRFNVAVRLHGKLKTSFPDGQPKDDAKSEPSSPATPSLSEGTSTVILVADVDMLYDRFCMRAVNLFGNVSHQPLNDNLSFFTSAIEQLAGSADLIDVRSRGKFDRSFTRVLELETKARKEWQAQEEQLMTKLRTAQQRMARTQPQKDDKQRFILSPEQKRAVIQFRNEEREISKKLKQVRKNLRRDIEDLGRKVKLLNIALMPILVIIAGIGFWAYRRFKK